MTPPLDSHRSHDNLDQLKRQAKELLRNYRASHRQSLALVALHYRDADPQDFALSDAQLVIARSIGFASWPKLKAFIDARTLARGIGTRAPFDAQLIQTPRPLHIGWIDPDGDNDPAGGGEATPGATTAHGKPVDVPPSRVWFVEPLTDLTPQDWTATLDEVRHRRIPGIYTRGRASDDQMPAIGSMGHLIFLDLSRSQNITDAGLVHLANLPNLEYLYLRNCPHITDAGLAVLAKLPALRVLRLRDSKQITGAGIAYLKQNNCLQLLTLEGTLAGDDALSHLIEKPALTHLTLSNQTTDHGMSLLPHFPGLAVWAENRPTHKITEYASPSPSFLGLAGHAITDDGMRYLEQLAGVTHLSLDGYYDSLKQVTQAGVASVTRMPRMHGLPLPGRLLTDDVCELAADMPLLTGLGFWDAAATDRGIAALARSKSITSLHLNKFHNLTGAGLAALAKLSTLRELNVGSRNCPDAGLASLEDFTELRAFSCGNENVFTDQAFKYIARAPRLQTLTNMFCRTYQDGKLTIATTDLSTRYITQSRTLRNYSVWGSFITDESCRLLAQMNTLQDLIFYGCPNLTNAGIAHLARLPRLHKLELQNNTGLTDAVTAPFDRSVQVSYRPLSS